MLSLLFQLQLRGSAGSPPDAPTAPGMVTSSCSGSGLGFRTTPPEEEGGVAEGGMVGDVLHPAGGWGLEGRAKVKGRRPSRGAEASGEEEDGASGERGGPGEDGGGVLRGLRGRAQGSPRLAMTSLRVSMGEPLTDHSVMPI